MNSRDYKILRPNCYYHIYNRGNNKAEIFKDSQDYLNFLKRLKLVIFPKAKLKFESRLRISPLPSNSFSLLSYCLMPNHFHLLIRQNSEVGLDRLIAKVCTSYAKYFNLKYGHIGNLFQDRFKAKLVDNDSYLIYLSAYIHNNAENPLEYDYSSLKDYLGKRSGNLCDKTFLLNLFDNNPEKYKKFVLGFDQEYEDKIKNYLFEE